LAACPTNAILFSFGDNDFYPVLYVQHKLGFRKDVHLINESLLGLDRYIFAATQPQFNSKGIQISVDTNFYKGNKNDYLSMELNDSTIPFSKVIQLIKNTKNNGAEPLKIPANYFKIKYKEHGLEVQFNVPFLLKNNWVLLDILNNLNGRKFCIPNSFYDSFKGLNKYFTEVENTGLRFCKNVLLLQTTEYNHENTSLIKRYNTFVFSFNHFTMASNFIVTDFVLFKHLLLQ
jgi:hypothetical protein